MIPGTGLRALISGCEATRLTASERSFFRDTRPCGFILFKRNCEDADQIRALVGDFREAVNDASALILIDQEGGRVQRLVPPLCRHYPAARRFAALHSGDAVKGLEAARNYRLTFEDGSNPAVTLSGDTLMHDGFTMQLRGTLVSELVWIDRT